jgi:hypothetical protein
LRTRISAVASEPGWTVAARLASVAVAPIATESYGAG